MLLIDLGIIFMKNYTNPNRCELYKSFGFGGSNPSLVTNISALKSNIFLVSRARCAAFLVYLKKVQL